MSRPNIKVLVIDDSASVRQELTSLLNRSKGIQVVGDASDAYEAKDLIIKSDPDVLLLDMDMPRMDGITFLKVLMKHHPMPVVLLSHLTRSGAYDALECANAGAVEILAKPSCDHQMATLGDELARKIRAAAEVKVTPSSTVAINKAPPIHHRAATYNPRQLILLGASTGGTEALREVLTNLPADLPGILIVQHIPPEFSRAFAERVNRLSALTVSEARHGDIVQPGTALVAPGDYHMIVQWTGDEYTVHLNQDTPIFHQRPSVDKLFDSAAMCCGKQAVAALLTGMGKDGAQGMLNLKNAGCHTIAQDRESCTVYGMPRAAVKVGAVCEQLPLEEIAAALVDHSRSPRKVAFAS